MKIEQTKGSSRAFVSQADDLESNESTHKLERTIGSKDSVAQQSWRCRPLSPML